jgi:hypothetical protein
MIYALKRKSCKGMKKMTKNRMGNLITVLPQLTEITVLIVNYFLFGYFIVMSYF